MSAIDEIIENIKKNATKENTTNNLFSVLGIGTKELMHSRFIAFLLAPNGIVHSGNDENTCLDMRHNYGTKFLEIFLKQYYKTKQLYATLKKYEIEINNNSLKKAQVFIEYEDSDCLDGRIDILIKIGSYWIGIENKIYAADQEKQLKRYHTYLTEKTKNKKFDLIYLSLDGHKPSDYSTDDLKNEKHYHIRNYKEFIKEYLIEIMTIVKENDPIKVCIEQYEKILEILLEKQDLSEQFLEAPDKSNKNSEDKWNKLINLFKSKNEQIKKYSKDLLLNYIYPTFIKNNIKLDNNYTQEGNIIYYWIASKKRKDLYILFEFTESLEVVYYPVLHDRAAEKNGKWYCINKKENAWINWTRDTGKFLNKRESIHKDLESFCESNKEIIKGIKSKISDIPLPLEKLEHISN